MVKIKAQDAADPEASTLKELPGFRFHPTDEELVNFYLRRRLPPQRSDSALSLLALLIPDIDIYRYDPWDLPRLARLGEGSSGYYFFSPRGKKYRNSARPNRVTLSGFWKATGTDRLVYSDSSNSKCIGLKKSLVFYHGRASRSMKSDWIMHEFRLASHQDCSENDACWALCKIFKRKSSNSQHSMVRSSLPQATIDISESTESFEAEESNEEDVKSEATRCAPLNPLCNDLLTSSSGILPPSSYHSEMKEAAVVGLEGPPKLTSPAAAGASALAPKAPLTVRMSQSNSWANDLLSSWMSPTGMKLSGQPCLAARDGNLWCNDQPFQESVMPADCLWPSSSLSPSMSDSILSLWD